MTTFHDDERATERAYHYAYTVATLYLTDPSTNNYCDLSLLKALISERASKRASNSRISRNQHEVRKSKGGSSICTEITIWVGLFTAFDEVTDNSLRQWLCVLTRKPGFIDVVA